MEFTKFEIVQIKDTDQSILKLHNKEAMIYEESFLKPGFYEIYIDEDCYEIHADNLLHTGKSMTYAEPKFKLFEIVKVITVDPDYVQRLNAEGAILHISQFHNGEIWYQTDINGINDPQSCLDLPEAYLVSTGKFGKYEDYYDGSHLTVSQNGDLKDGEFK